MQIPISSSLIQLNAEVFLQEGFELSLDAIIPSIELTGSFTPFVSKTQFFIYDYAKTILYENLNYNNDGSYLPPSSGTSTSTSTNNYNQFELNPTEDVYDQGYSSGKYYTVYNFIDYELGSELSLPELPSNSYSPEDPIPTEEYNGHPYFIKEISGDRTELKIQNNFLTSQQIETYYNEFKNKLDARENADEFYISFGNNRNFIGVNSQLITSPQSSPTPTSILIKLYQPLPSEFQLEQQLQIISKVGETQVFEVEFKPNLEFVDNLLSLKGPNYNISIKDKINNSTNFKTLKDLINTNSSQSYYQFNSLQDQKGVILRKNWGDWNEFVKYSSAEQRLDNFYDKMVSIEGYEAELSELETITLSTTGSIDYSSSYNNVSNNINKIISKFDSYEYFLYYITGSESWPKYTTTYPYNNYSYSSSQAINWFGSTDEASAYFNTGKNQIYSASRYDNDNQDYLYYLIPPFITDNSSNDQYVKFVNMTGQAFDEMYLYTEAVEQVRNTNSGLTGSVLPLGLADEVIESLGFDTYGNDFNSTGFNVNNIGVFPATGSGLEYITRYVDIASGSVINYYDQQQSTLGYVIALADPSFPYPIDNAAQEIYKRIFHNAISLVKRKGTVTGLRQLINIWGVPNTMLRISEFGGKNKDDKNDYDLWMNRYSTAFTTYNYKSGNPGGIPSASVRIPWNPLTSNYVEDSGGAEPDKAVPDCIQFRFKNSKPTHSDSVFSQSLFVKNSANISTTSDMGLILSYSGSQSGSFSGSTLPTDQQYGNLQFVISGSVSEGALGDGYFITDPISLPFFNDGWWSIQLQRITHTSASNEDSTLNEFELKVANNIYDGYDGNQIGFQGSASITMPGGVITSSLNASWNKYLALDQYGMDYTATDPPGPIGLALGGYMNPDISGGGASKYITSTGTGGKFLGDSFSGSFQEFRYYRRALSSSQFNDYVMNPESIQGHSDSTTGAGSSYDLLSFRLPLGNELEYNEPFGLPLSVLGKESTKVIWANNFGSIYQETTATSIGLSSLHPSIVNSTGTLFTSSFVWNTLLTSSAYTIIYQGTTPSTPDFLSISASYLAPNTEINYMDQPSAGIRNRIKNKIQVIDGNEYGTTLSPFRSIQQEFEQSSSYTEDLNSLEVGFSFQNEINDDIIATFGHGVVSDAIADPRLISESSDRYPELTRISEDYFKKYQSWNVNAPNYTGLPTIIEKEYDYNRLIKFYETSLFKAIKNYVPARTSLSTGIIVKQHLLERNKTDAVIGMHTNTPIANTPETGSDSWGYTDQTGFNSVLAQQNLLITSSINMYSLTGSAGGSVNKYNTPTSSITAFTQSWTYLDDFTGQTLSHSIQDEFYNGEFSGSNIPVELNEYNPYRIYADGTNKNPDTTTPYTPATLNLGAGTYSTDRFPSGVTTTSATAVAVRATASLVYPSGSAVGANSSDSLLFKGISDSTTNRTIKLISDVVITRYYVNIGASTSMNDAAAQSKLLFISYATGDLSNYTTVSTGIVPSGTGTNVSTTLSNGSKQITANISWAGGSVGSCRVVDADPLNDNDANWFVVGDTFSGFPTGMGTNIDFLITATSMTQGLVGVQFMNDGTAAGTKANLKSAIESSNGHNGKINVVSTTNGSDEYLTLKQLTLGITGNTAITYAGSFANNSSGVIEASKAFGASPKYLAPTEFQGGVNALASSTKYLQNAITGLTPGVTYEISFDITGYANDGLGGSSYEVGMSSLDSPGGIGNGVGMSIRATSNGIVTGTWTQAASTSTAMFLAHAGVYATISNVVITPPTSILAPKHFYERDSFTIMPTGSQLFQASPYNPLLNNVSGSRKNSFLFDQDFDPVSPGFELKQGIPNDYTLTISASQLGWEGTATNDDLLEYSEIPDSNYTTTAIINPRYEGCLLESADYNFYTGIPSESLAIGKSSEQGIIGLANPPYLLKQNKVQYINGETGSWTGDTSFGKNAVIDINPINFAHFKQSYENLSVFDTSTFIIDQLIQIPFEEILNEQSPIITSSLIDGSNENLISVSSTFSPSRKVAIIYNNPTKTFVEFNNTILNYGQLGIGSNLITAGATDWKTYCTNQLLPSIMTVTQSFYAPEYTRLNLSNTTQFQAMSDTIDNQIGLNFWYPEDRAPFLPTVDSPNLIDGNISASWGMSLFSTGSSTYAENKGFGILNLRGLPFNIPIRPTNLVGGSAGILYGPSLQIMNSLNRCQIIYGDANPSFSNGISTYSPGIQNLLKLVADAGSTSYDTFWGSQAVVGNSMGMQSLGTSATSAQSNIIPILDPNNIANLYRTDFSGSGLNNYEQLPNSEINIEPGDEIRVSYGYPTDQSSGASGTGVIQNIIQDFQVIEYELSPPVVVTDVFSFPGGSSTFNVYLSNLITSSNVEFRNNPFQIDEYKRRLDIGITNDICMYFADTNNSTEDTIASGSFLNNCHYDSYVVNNEGENRPTKIRVVINRTAVRYPNNTTGNTGATGGWQFGTNNYGIVAKSLNAYGTGYALQGPYATDGESYPRSVNADPGFLFDRLIVSPNPSTLAQPIPSGSILSATLRKRLEDDSRVVINLNQPQGSQGIQTPSGDGYLIPDDLTNIQQRNVQKIINKLKSENVFTQDSPDSLGS